MSDKNTVVTNVVESSGIENNKTLQKNEAYKKANEINQKDKSHHAKVENGELVVQNVLKG